MIPRETRFKSLNEIFAQYFEINLKVSDEIMEFSDIFFLDGYYNKNLIQMNKLGEGGYGVVCKAKWKGSENEIYAIKKAHTKN